MSGHVPDECLADRPRWHTWRKSSYSGKEGNCVEVALLSGGLGGLRDSHDPDGPALTCPARVMGAFLAATKDGEFDGVDL